MERREAFITGVVLAVTSALITAIVLVGAGPEVDDPLVAGAASSPGSGAESTPDELDPLEDDPTAELDAFVVEAVAFVEATKGRDFLTEPVVRVLSDTDFVARVDADLTEDFEADSDAVEMYNAIYRATGLIAADDSVDDAYRAFGAAGVLGFYDPATDELVVRQVDELSLLTKSTIVHELTHAFDDQHFDLDRPEYDDRTDEVGWTFQAVAEGSATWVESRWKERLDPAEKSDLFEEELSFGDPSMFDRFELSFLIYELSPYEFGEPFVEHLVDGGAMAALDDALRTPPATSEQVIIPSRFDEGEIAIPLDPPSADGEPVYEGVGGQALIEALFQGNGVFRAVEWGGDQMSVWVADDESCLRWLLESETAAGADELRAGFEEWAAQVGNASVTEIDATTVRVDRCA